MKVFKRYIVFGFDTYYPNGGFNDYLGDFDSIADIDELIERVNDYWTFNGFARKAFQIFDCEERVLVQTIQDKPGFL